MATYANDLRLTELGTGDEIGSWGRDAGAGVQKPNLKIVNLPVDLE